ncbi:RtcB family protein [bacterium]|nr:RtcB family protein [bacterium]
MIEIIGKYNNATVFTKNIEDEAIQQIKTLCNQEFSKNSKIRIMPDVHAGAGCTIGTTMTISDKVVPNLVGVDIGCGMETIILKERKIDLELVDKSIRKYVPSGFQTRDSIHKYIKNVDLESLYCINHINKERAEYSIGTLGGGNHFIELNIDDNENIYLVVHSGSRNLGKQVAEYYQKLAIKKLSSNIERKKEIIKQLKNEGRESEIQETLNSISIESVPNNLAYLKGEDLEKYLHDMNIVQQFALWNRKAIVDTMIDSLGLNIAESFTTIHNYIEMDTNILRKGAISAKKGEIVLIPINMRDGSLICEGLGNSDWNYSAPHGAGRLMSRTKAKATITLNEFKNSMEGIYTTSINSDTIDEAPMAYKPIEEIIEYTKDSVKLLNHIKPIYNFKASE